MLAFPALRCGESATVLTVNGRQRLTRFLSACCLAGIGAQAQSVAIGWRVYEVSHSPMALGWIGLVQFLPRLLLSLPGGELCDRLRPGKLMGFGLCVQALCSGALLVLSLAPVGPVWTFYAVILASGAARAFSEPAEQAQLPLLVSSDRLANAISWSSTLGQISVIAGPALGGLIYAIGPAAAYTFCCAAFLAAAIGASMSSVGSKR